jgi:PD-(D/E)XK nuclease superfamily
MATAAIHRLSPQEVSHAIITAAMSVHCELGPALLESAYQACFHHELQQAGIQSACQVGLPVVFVSGPEWKRSETFYPLRTRRFTKETLEPFWGAGL